MVLPSGRSNYNIYIYIIYIYYIYKAISLHSGVITIHSGVRHLQLVLSVTLSWTLGKQKRHRFCMFPHNVPPAANFIFVSCFWCCEHAVLRCASFGSEHHTTILAIQAHTLTDKWCGNVWVRKSMPQKNYVWTHFFWQHILYNRWCLMPSCFESSITQWLHLAWPINDYPRAWRPLKRAKKIIFNNNRVPDRTSNRKDVCTNCK